MNFVKHGEPPWTDVGVVGPSETFIIQKPTAKGHPVEEGFSFSTVLGDGNSIVFCFLLSLGLSLRWCLKK